MVDEPKETQPISDQGMDTANSEGQVAQPTSRVDTPNPFSEPQSVLSKEESNAKEGKEQLQDSKIQFPDTVPSDVADIHMNTFKEAGVESDKAQKVIDALAQYEEKAHAQHIEDLRRSLEDDKRTLQQELGSDYDTRIRDVARYFHEENIPDSDVQSLVTEWGFQKTFDVFRSLCTDE